MKEARLNIQGLARKDLGYHNKDLPGLCSYLTPEPGHTFVSLDLSAGEPSVIAHYSRDALYRYATLDGVGKAPYWQDGIFYIDDIYIMVAASTDVGRPEIRVAWDRDWGGKTFAEQWLIDAEVIKKALGKTRKMFKTIALALGYGMGVAKMGKQVLEQYGVELSEKQCRDIHKGYWSTFVGLRAFVRRCQERAQKGYIVNDFGYRLTFDATGERGKDTTHKAYNYLIQSSVSGVIHVLTMFLFEECAKRDIDAHLVAVIHDEDVVSVPTERLEDFRVALDTAVTRINSYLSWTVPIRTGFSPGATFFDAH